MRIEMSTMDEKGVISASVVELTAEQIGAIVKQAHEVTRLRRAGHPLEQALGGLDDALVSAQVIEPNQQPRAVQGAPGADLSLAHTYGKLLNSAVDAVNEPGRVLVSREALNEVGDAVHAAFVPGVVESWKWTPVKPNVGVEERTVDMQAVLEKMNAAAQLGGAPSIREAMAKYPMQFCAALAELQKEEDADRMRGAAATTILHLENDDGQTMLSIVAPGGMSEVEVKRAVQVAVEGAGDIDRIAARLSHVGFSPVEHVVVSLPPLGDEDVENLGPAPTH